MKCWVSGQNSSWSSRVNLAENYGEYWQNTIFLSATSSDPENDISGANFENRKHIQLCGRFCRFFLKFSKFYWNAEFQVPIRVGHHEWIWLKITESIHKTLYFHLLQALIQKIKYLAPIFKNRKNIQLCGRFCRFFLKFLKFYWNAEVQVQIRVGHHEWIWLKITESIGKTQYFHPLQAQIQKMTYLAPILKIEKISNFVGDFVGFP